MSDPTQAQTGRPDRPLFDDSELEKIAELAAEKAIKKLTNHVYQEVGKSVISKFVLRCRCLFAGAISLAEIEGGDLMLPIVAGLLAQGLNLVGNAVLAKGKEWVEEKTGVKLAPDMPPEELAKLRQFELEHEEELQRLQLEENRLTYEDTKSARDMNTRINESADATWLSKNVPAILALVVIVGGGIVLTTTSQADVRTAVVGLMTLVLGFYFGTSSSSRNKDVTIERLTGGAK